MSRCQWLLAVLVGAACQAAPQPTLVVEFEDGLDGLGRDGAVKATAEGQPELVAGKFGQALKSGPATGYLHYPTAGIVSAKAGTVEMWVCPVDWAGTEEKFHAFFDVRGQGALYLYKYYQGGLLMLSCADVAGPYMSASAGIGGWKPGQWHHIAGTWSPREQHVYVDGKRIGSTQPGLPKSLGAEFVIGDHPWHIARTSSSLVDRVRIYDRCLSDDHLAAHFAGDYDKSVALGTGSSSLSIEVERKSLKLSARVDTIADETDGATVRFELARGTAVVRTQDAVSLADGWAASAISLAGVAAGAYAVRAVVDRQGQEVARLEQPLTVLETSWAGNKLGREDKVLPPWTPLRTGTEQGLPTVGCLGRQHVFAGGLPSRISSAGAELLSRPVGLVVTTDQGPQPWQPASAVVTSSGATRAVIEGTGRSGPVNVRVKTVIEYDGVMDVTLAIAAPAEAKVASVSLDLPLRPEVVFYRHRWAPSWAGKTGNLPPGEGAIDAATFLPYAWLGDNDRGLFWFCETDQFWPNAAAADAFQTVREPGAVVMRLNLVNGQPVPAGWDYRFGLQATPAKPLPRDWRKWRMDPAPRANIAILWPTPQKDSMSYFGYAEATHPETFQERIAKLRERGVGAVPYSCLTFFSAASPEWPWFKDEWQTGSGDSSSSDVAAYGAVFARVNPLSESYSDFIVWKNVEFVKRYGLAGVYHDNSHPYGIAPPTQGGGWRDEQGHWHQTYPMLAYRDLFRRLYGAVKDANPDSWLMAHMSGKVGIPFLAYEDAYLDGEHFRGHVQDSYLELVSLDTFRAEFMGRQWGLMPYFLPEFRPPYSEQVEPTRGLMGLLLLHDVAPWPIWCNLKPVIEMYDALDAFGYVESEFIPYFDPTPPVKTALPDVHGSVYKRADGRALVVVANLSREDRQGRVTLEAKRIGLPVDRLLSWPDRAALRSERGTVELTVPRLGYRLLLVGTPPGG